MSKETKIKGMGSILHAGGVAFRVWVPHAQNVCYWIIQSMDASLHPMQSEKNGY